MLSRALSWWTGPINWYYVLSICVVGCGSIPKGWDEGGFSAATSLPSFKNTYDLNTSQWEHDATGLANRKAAITSLGVLGAAFGALLALAMADRLGRLRSWQVLAGVYMSGVMMQAFASGSYSFMLFARLWGGLGAGGLTVVGPLYLSEVAPAKSRGMVVSISMVFLLTFLSLGFFINYAANVTLPGTSLQYRLVIAIPLIPTGTALIASFFIADTPRWLASKDRGDDAFRVLSKLRHTSLDDQQLRREYAEMQEQIRSHEQLLSGVTSWDIVKEVWSVPSYRQRFLLATAMQTIAQWSGGNGITYYIPQIFEYAGVKGNNTSLLTSGVYGLVKLFFTLVFTWGLVDVIGRRRCFLYGLSMQLGAHIFSTYLPTVPAFMQMASKDHISVQPRLRNLRVRLSCSSHASSSSTNTSPVSVYMGVWVSHGEADQRASQAAIASVFVYAIGWSIGLCTVQFLYATEIFPTRIRGVCYAFDMFLHWLFQFAVVRVTPNMFVSLRIWGTYTFYACVCAVGLIVLGLWAPETNGVPMERMGELFSGPWWNGWRAKVDIDRSDTQTLRRSRPSSPGDFMERGKETSV